MAKTIKLNTKLIKTYQKKVQDTNVIIYNTIADIKRDIQALEEGNAEGPYWNGARAYKWFNEALGNCDRNYALYEELKNVEGTLNYTTGMISKKDKA